MQYKTDLKLRGFLLSSYEVNPCEPKNRY